MMFGRGGVKKIEVEMAGRGDRQADGTTEAGQTQSHDQGWETRIRCASDLVPQQSDGYNRSRILLNRLHHVQGGLLVFGLDETIEWRSGWCIAAKGRYLASVRSWCGHFVKTTGPRWLRLMWRV